MTTDMDDNQHIGVGQLTEHYKVPVVTSKEDVWEKLLEKIENSEKDPKVPTVKSLYTLISLSAAAAIIFCVFYFTVQHEPHFSPEIVTSFGEVEKCILPDGSTVALNSNSSLKYDYNRLLKHRKIKLKGDALFDVKKGGEFLVDFFGGEVRVTGTSFYLSAYSSQLLQVDCLSGAVEVNMCDAVYLLTAGNSIKCFNGVAEKYSCKEENVRNRLNGLFYWEKISMGEIDLLAEYRFGYNIILEPGLETRHFAGQLDFNDLQSCLDVISMAMDVDYLIDEERKMISINAR